MPKQSFKVHERCTGIYQPCDITVDQERNINHLILDVMARQRET